MGTNQLDELLKDELAGDQPIHAWEYTLQALLTHADPPSLSKYRMRELLRDIQGAHLNLSRYIERHQSTGILKKLDPNGELERFLTGLDLAKQSFGAANGASRAGIEIVQGLSEAIDEEVFRLVDRQARLFKSANQTIAMMEGDTKEHMLEAITRLEHGLVVVGPERSGHFHAARTAGLRVQSSPVGDRCMFPSLIAAVAEWKMTRSIEETGKILRRIWPAGDSECSLVLHLGARMHGNLELMDEDPHAAWTLFAKGDEQEADPDLILERARLAISLGKIDAFIQIAKRGMQVSNLFVVRLLAAPEMEKLGSDLITLIAERQQAVRLEVDRELNGLNGDIRQIRKIKKLGGFEMPFVEICEGTRRALAPRVAEADMFLAISLLQQVKDTRHDAARMSREVVKREYEIAAKKLQEAKGRIDQAWAERDAMVDAAVREQKVAAERTREALRKSLAESDRNQMGCVMGFGSGCGAFLLYLVIAAVLATQGVQAGYGTIFGWFGLTATAVPILFAVFAQITYGVQRAALDAALHERIKATQIAYEAAVKKADRFCRDKVTSVRDSIPELEGKAHRAEEALKLMNAFATAGG